MTEYKNIINGKEVESISKRRFENRNPANWEEVVGIFPKSTREDVEEAIQAAKKAYQKWRFVPAPKRAEILRKAAEIMIERKEDLARLMTREMGKILKETRGDVQEGIDTGLYAGGEGRRLFGRTTPSELNNKICYTYHQPLGVWGIISPWNFPIAIPSWKIFPALLTGNTVVFKPATDTPASAYELVKILHEAGVPDGVVNIVFGSGREVGEALLEHPDIAGISFTGSSEVGRRIAEVTGKNLKRCSLELGGKNGQIVLEDADLKLALEGVIWGAFGTTGQRCTATSRLILVEAVYDEFLAMVKERASRIIIGNGLREETEMGPLINEAQRNTVHSYVEIGKGEGAELYYGGEIYQEGECSKGWFYKPTIFIGVRPEMRIAREEIFGPVLSVIKVKDLDEAIEVLNNTSYGLSSSIYTRDVNRAFYAIERIEAGITYVNAPTIGAECHLPFGGVKDTGNGHREGGWTAYEIFTETKTVYIDYSGSLQKAQIDTWEEQ
ncbi:aldehyde dehydrogenase [candidate division WOR-3 bacterium]|uniref:Aldehyde dehydrogenase n=1 Tax=candidate division WOR-3 bacterium TaxID=2052148 RepID=A0A660SNI0_UNCW3|nr:MAG: aldehyde dehydrogenase [candidate division WOR-3 bacterium]